MERTLPRPASAPTAISANYVAMLDDFLGRLDAEEGATKPAVAAAAPAAPANEETKNADPKADDGAAANRNKRHISETEPSHDQQTPAPLSGENAANKRTCIVIDSDDGEGESDTDFKEMSGKKDMTLASSAKSSTRLSASSSSTPLHIGSSSASSSSSSTSWSHSKLPISPSNKPGAHTADVGTSKTGSTGRIVKSSDGDSRNSDTDTTTSDSADDGGDGDLDEDNETDDSDHDSDSDGGRRTNKKQRGGKNDACAAPVPTLKKTSSWACMSPTTGAEANPNKHITDLLEKLLKYHTSTRDKWRVMGYQRAISAIKRYPKKIESLEEAEKIPNVGKKIAAKIKEIIDTSHLRKVDMLPPVNEAMDLFQKVHGMGYESALKFYNKGCRTLEDLVSSGLLNHQQAIGVKHFHEIQQRIPREEVKRIGDVVTAVAHQIDPDLEVHLCGSYRRLKETCGDVDILVTHANEERREDVLSKLVARLSKQGFVTDKLSDANDEKQEKFMGVCRLPGGLHRRIDIICVPYAELGAALLYFTGNDYYNRSMRLMANKRGWSLNQHGLFAGVIRKKGVKLTSGTLIASATEKEILDLLGLTWVPPEQRNP